MEFGFNLAWLILSLTLSVGWAWSARRSTTRHTHRLTFFALIVLIALLFPVVSISDDLHEDQAKITSEEPRYKDDLQHQLECARLYLDQLPSLLNVPLTLDTPAENILRSEEVRPFAAFMFSSSGFPPALHDLPPPTRS